MHVSICRHDVIHKLQNSHALVILITDNLTRYVDSVRRATAAATPSSSQDTRPDTVTDPTELFPDGRYNHITQVQVNAVFFFRDIFVFCQIA